MDQLSPCHHPTALTSYFRVKFGFWRTECGAGVCDVCMLMLCWWYFTIIWAYRGTSAPSAWHVTWGTSALCSVHLYSVQWAWYRWCSTVYTWAVLCHHQVGYPRSHSVPIPLMPELLRDSQSWSSVNMSPQYLLSMSSELVTYGCDTGTGYNMMCEVGGAGWGWRGWSLVSHWAPPAHLIIGVQ